MSYPVSPLAFRVRIAPGTTNFSADPATYPWVDITTYVDTTFPIEDSIGTTDDAAETNTEFTCTLRNNDGRFTPDYAESPYWPNFVVGCPIEWAIDCGDGSGWHIQCITYLGSVEVSWPANTPLRCIATIVAGGQFRRLGLDPPIGSALRRTIPSSAKRKAYWPLEDENGASQAASAVVGVPPLQLATSTAPDFGSTAGVPGTASVARFKAGDRLFAALPSPTTATSFRASFTLYAPTAPGASVVLFELPATGGTIAAYRLELGTASLRFRAVNSAGTDLSGAGAVGFTDQYTQTVYCDVDVAQSGSNIAWTIRTTRWAVDVTGQPVGTSGVISSSFAGTVGQITGVYLAPYMDLVDVELGHFALTEPPLPAAGGLAAVVGWAGNTATGRLQGMANEFGMPSSVTSTTLGSVMGPQLVDTLLANLRDIPNTDHGILSDHLGVVSYRATSELYNITPTLSLSKAVRGHIGQIAPLFDDQVKANVAGASRPGGSTFIVRDDADILRSGKYERAPITPNVATDAALPGQAGWSLARGRGSERGPRLPELTFNMRVACEVTPTIATDVLNLKLGDRLQILANPPQMAKVTVERQVRGRKQKVTGRYGWEVTFFLVPTEPYDVLQLDLHRLDTAGTEVVLAATSTDTVVMAATAGATVTPGTGLSISLNAAGEQVTLTAAADEPIVDSFTRSVSSGWGSIPATAHLPAYAWTCIGSGTVVASSFNVTGTAGTIVIGAAGDLGRCLLAGISMINPALYFEGSYPVLATGNNLELECGYRRLSNQNYTFRITLNPSAEVRALLYTPSGALIADVPTGITHTAGQVYKILAAPIGSRHLCKVWTGVTEPPVWTIDVRDTERTIAGTAQVRAGRAVGNTNASATATFDNFSIRNTQALTFTRSVNGVVKALPLQSDIRLWKGRGLAL